MTGFLHCNISFAAKAPVERQVPDLLRKLPVPLGNLP
jgi:hypothetical protein